MRTSNKILIGILVATILLFTSLFATVRIKYERGDIVKNYREPDREPSADQPISGPVKQVNLFLLGNVTIIPSDSLKLKIWGNENHGVKYEVKDGVLTIMADTLQNRNGNHPGRAYQHIELFIPAVDSLFCFDSEIIVKQLADSGKLKTALNFRLDAATLRLEQQHVIDGPVTYFESLKVNANPGSRVEVDEGITIGQADFRLYIARLNGNGRFNKLAIQTDSKSSIDITGENLRKAIITSTE